MERSQKIMCLPRGSSIKVLFARRLRVPFYVLVKTSVGPYVERLGVPIAAFENLDIETKGRNSVLSGAKGTM